MSTQRRPQTAGAVDALRRKVRNAEGHQREWQDATQKELRRQKLELESLRREHDELQQRLNEMRAQEVTKSLAVSRAPHAVGVRRSRDLDHRRETLTRLETRLHTEEVRGRELSKNLEDVAADIAKARARVGGVNAVAEGHDVVRRQVTVLENRLDQSLQRFNNVLRQNKQLRDAIDTLRGERDVFEGIYQRLEEELHEKKKEMAFVIEVSNIAYEERDNNEECLKNLKAFANEELASFDDTFRELDALLEEDRRMKESVKQRIAVLEKREALRQDGDRRASSTGSPTRAPPPAARRDSQQGPDGTDATSTAQQYEEAFLRLRQSTDVADIDQLVVKFLQAEEHNFSLFAYVNDLRREIDALEQQRRHVHEQITSMTVGSAEDQQRRDALHDLEARLRVEEKRNATYVEGTKHAEEILRRVMAIVEELFGRLDCDESAVLQQHGIRGVTFDTLILYLAAVEQRTDEYLLSWAVQSGPAENSKGVKQLPERTQVVVDAKRLPGTGEEVDGSDDDDRPLGREELLRRVQRKMSAQASGAERRQVRQRRRR